MHNNRLVIARAERALRFDRFPRWPANELCRRFLLLLDLRLQVYELHLGRVQFLVQFSERCFRSSAVESSRVAGWADQQ